MTEVLFYHLTESRVEDALPSLVERSLERGWRVALEFADPELCDRIDRHLWTFRDDSFVPHGRDEEEGAADQPVLLTLAPENPNRAQIRFLVGNADGGALDGYARVAVMFDGHDEAQLVHARTRWKALKAAAHQLTYWKQDSNGRWQKQAG